MLLELCADDKLVEDDRFSGNQIRFLNLTLKNQVQGFYMGTAAAATDITHDDQPTESPSYTKHWAIHLTSCGCHVYTQHKYRPLIQRIDFIVTLVSFFYKSVPLS